MSHESLSRNHDMDELNSSEGVASYADEPKSFEEHMKEWSLPTEKENATSDSDRKHEQDVGEARNAVLEAFDKNEIDDRIINCKNRVFKSEFGPRYDDNPNVFRTNEASVYRIAGIDQIADIVNCGYIRPKEGKIKGGHENEVYWSIGGDSLSYIDKRPILETSADTVKDGQVGAVSLDDLTAVWMVDGESSRRENKLDVIKNIKSSMGKDEQLNAEELSKRIKDAMNLDFKNKSF